MFLRPDRDDARIVGFYVGKVINLLGLLQAVPATLALLLNEWNALTAFGVGGGLAVTFGRLTDARLRTRRELEWSHGMLIVALSWLVGSIFCAVPLYLSGHFQGYVDAMFEAMSGLTTSGLSLTQDVDHLAYSMNLWRHLTHFAGGQGIVLAVLTLFAGAAGRAGTLYVGEARDERIMPNVIRSARFIWRVSFAYLAVGTVVLFVAIAVSGVEPWRALFDATNLLIAAFDTGGFTPHSPSVAYYHSYAVEATASVFMVAGALSFGVHYQLWRGDRRELMRHIETRSLVVTMLILSALAFVGLGRAGTFTDAGPMFRKGFFTILSAHTGTGFQVNSPRLFATEWGLLAPAAVVGAMALGGMASSTAGGIKAIRIGITAKGLLKDIRRVLLPESALVVETYHAQRRRILRDEQIRSAVTILTLYLLTYLAGGVLGLFYGFEFTEAMFESTSATANVGLSIGIVAPDLAMPLKLTYIVQMWVGRLEFMAVFALIA
ncbi:MAG TPA: TrkH family potassium uptake protein, partial [Nitriliruptorales bacterium]|nr:TrkH family potassium uptake protein [Nitriliruptorales bacterium]